MRPSCVSVSFARSSVASFRPTRRPPAASTGSPVASFVRGSTPTRALRWAFGLVLALALGWTPAAAQTSGVGVGAAIGVTNDAGGGARNPIGLSVKVWGTDRFAAAGVTSFFIGDEDVNSYWILQGDALFHNFNELAVGDGLLALYVGPGMQVTINEDVDNELALRAPLGLTYLLGSTPVDVFVEVAPTLQVTDPATLRFDGAIGFRYFFE